MKYEVLVKRNVTKKIRSIPKPYIAKVYAAFKELAKHPRPSGSKKLKGKTETYRLRIGIYRIIYTIDDVVRIVHIERLLHRQEGYQSKK